MAVYGRFMGGGDACKSSLNALLLDGMGAAFCCRDKQFYALFILLSDFFLQKILLFSIGEKVHIADKILQTKFIET